MKAQVRGNNKLVVTPGLTATVSDSHCGADKHSNMKPCALHFHDQQQEYKPSDFFCFTLSVILPETGGRETR